MSRRLPPLNALKVFEAAARNLSLLKPLMSCLSRKQLSVIRIKTLEDHLGLKLFLRRNRALLLTEEGQAYFADIKETFNQLVDATERLLARGAKGSVAVSLTPSFAIQWLVPRLQAFNELHPEIDVRIKAQILMKIH